MSRPQLTAISADQRLADFQRRYDQAHPPEKQGTLTRVLRFTGEYGVLLVNPVTFPVAATKFAFAHRANSRCVAEALARSDARMQQLLVQQFDGINMEMVYPILKEIAKEVAIYVGGGAVVGGGVGALFGGVGALPGATMGARVGFWLMTLLGLGKLLIYVASDALPQMVTLYSSGFAKAWRAGDLPPTETAKRAQLMYVATEDFAQGHIKLLIAILTAVVVYLTKGQMKTLVAELNASKLGPKFAQWIEANEARLVQHPALQPHKPLGQAVREAAKMPGETVGRRARPAPASTGTVAETEGTGVAFFGKDNLPYYTGDETTLGREGSAYFFMPHADGLSVKNASDAARLTGMAPSAQRAYIEGGDIYGITFPTKGMSPKLPTSADAGGWPHFLEGGHTAVALPENGGYLVNATREFVIPGGQPAPPGSILFKLGADGSRETIRGY